jgi:hypothetical protein
MYWNPVKEVEKAKPTLIDWTIDSGAISWNVNSALHTRKRNCKNKTTLVHLLDTITMVMTFFVPHTSIVSLGTLDRLYL